MFFNRIAEIKFLAKSLRPAFMLVLCVAAQMLLHPVALSAQSVAFIGAQSTVPVNGSIAPSGGVSVDAAGDVFVVGTGGSIEEIPAGGGAPLTIASDAAGSGVAFDSLGAATGALQYLSQASPGAPIDLVDVDLVSGAWQTPKTLATSLIETSAVVSVPLTAGPELMVVFSGQNGQLEFLTRSSGVYSTAASIPNALSAGGLSLALAPLANGGAFLAFEGPDDNFYYAIYAGGSWSTPASLGLDVTATAATPLAFDSKGDLFVTGLDAGIDEWPWAGTSLFAASTTPNYGPRVQLPAQVSSAAGMAGDGLGNVYVADTGNSRIVKWSTSSFNFGTQAVGTSSPVASLHFSIPSGTTVGSIAVLTQGSPNLDFASATGTSCTATTNSSAAVCEVNASFTPKFAGTRMGAVVFFAGAGNTGTVLASVPVYGVGIGAQISFQPSPATTISPVVNGLSLTDPSGQAVDGAGDLYIVDAGAHRLVEIPAGGGVPLLLGASLNLDGGIIVDGAGDLFYTEEATGVIELPAGGGAPITLSLLGLTNLYFNGMAMDGAGDLFLGGGSNDEVIELPAGGGAPIQIKPVVDGIGLLLAYGVAVDPAGNLFVSDYDHGRVVEIPAGGGAATAISPVVNGVGLGQVTGVAVDTAENLFISDTSHNRIVEVPGNGTPPFAITQVDGVSLNSPEGLSLDSAGDLFIADAANSRIAELVRSESIPFNFPSITVIDTLDTTDGTDIVQVTNIGNEPLQFTGLLYPTDFSPADGAGNACTSSTSLSVAQSCELPIDFFPQSTGNLSEQVKLTDNAGDAPGSQQFISVAGQSSTPQQVTVGASPAGAEFTVDGVVYFSAQTFTWAVGAPHTLSTPASQMDGGVVYDFTGWSDGTTGTTDGITVKAGVSTYTASYTTVAGPAQGDLNLGSQGIGTAGSVQTASFTFSSGITVGSIGILTTGRPNLDFTDGGSTTCVAQTYTSTTTCQVSVKFSPLDAGLRTGAVVFFSGANNSGSVVASLPIYGIGTGAQIAFGPGIPAVINPNIGAGSYFTGAAVDAAGNLYTSDLGNNTVDVIAPGGGRNGIQHGVQFLYLSQTSGGNIVDGRAAEPYGVALDGAGNLFLADPLNNRVIEVPAAASTVSESGNLGYFGATVALDPTVNGIGLNSPYGVSTDVQGNLYIADSGNNRIVEIPVNGGTPIVIAPTVNGSPLSSPYGLALDGSGNLFIADTGNSRVVQVPAGTGPAVAIAPTVNGRALNQPSAVAVDAAGDLFISDSSNNRVVEIPTASTPIAIDPFVGYGSLLGPFGIAVDSVGNLFIADSNNSRVVEMQRGQIPTVNFPTATGVGASDTTDGTETVQAVNIGNQPLKLTALTYPADFPQATGDTNACTGSTTLTAGQQCDLPINFLPETAGSLSESLTLTDNSMTASSGSQSIPITGTSVGGTYFSVTGTTPVAAGTAFPLTVTALNASAQTLTGFNGSVTLVSSDPLFVNPGPVTLTNGTGQAFVSLETVGLQTISVTASANSALTGSGSFTVTPGATVSLQISAPSAATSGAELVFTVKALDAYGNTTTGYNGTVGFTSSDPSAILPAASAIASGTGIFNATLKTPGTQTITAIDTGNNLTGASSGIVVTPPNLVVTTAADDAGLAASCTPQSTPGSGTDAACSLRDALASAKISGAANISFSSTVFNAANSVTQNTITVGSAGSLSIPSYASILGPTSGSGATLKNLVTISGANTYTVFTVNAGVAGASLSNLTITSGSSAAGVGGGIDNSGSLTVANSTLSANQAAGVGGAINNSGSLTVSGSTFSGNQATGSGGGIFNQSGATLTVSNSTLAANTAGEFGGGVYSDGNFTAINDTIYANSASIAAGGIVFGAGSASLANTIVAGNTAQVDADVVGSGTNNGGNLIGSSSIDLAPLAIYGGPMQTMLPLPGSAAICAGTANTDTRDERGGPMDPSCPAGKVDAGAVQSNYALSFTTSPSASQAIGVALTPSPVVVLTESGSLASAVTSTVVLSDSANLLAGAKSVVLSGGSATFSNLTLTAATSNDHLTASISLNPNLSPQLNLVSQSNTGITTASSASALTSPTPGAVLAGPTVTFTWTAGSGVTENSLHVGTTGAGSTNIFGGTVTGQSKTLTNIPTTGGTLNVRLYSLINGAWQYVDYTYTEDSQATPANMTSPAAGSTLTSSAVTFSWTTGTLVTQYDLHIGTTGVGSSNIFAGTVTGQSQGVMGIPTSGSTLYVRLYSLINGAWQYTDYTYTEASLAAPATMTSPTPGSMLTGSAAAFSWTPGTLVTQYDLHVGTTGAGSTNIFGGIVTGQSKNITGIPITGGTLYVRLYSFINKAWQYIDYTYTEYSVPAPATMTSPTPGSTLTGSGATFTWTTGSQVTQYDLHVGSTGVGSSNIFGGSVSGQSQSVTGIPATGGTLYVRLYSFINKAWQYIDYTYQEQ